MSGLLDGHEKLLRDLGRKRFPFTMLPPLRTQSQCPEPQQLCSELKPKEERNPKKRKVERIKKEDEDEENTQQDDMTQTQIDTEVFFTYDA